MNPYKLTKNHNFSKNHVIKIMCMWKKYLSNHFQLEQIWLSKNSNKNVAKVNKMYVINVTFSSKKYCFQMFMLFCQRKLQLLRNRMRLELKRFPSQVKRIILLKKKNIRDRTTCWGKKDKLVPGGTSFCIRKSWILTG